MFYSTVLMLLRPAWVISADSENLCLLTHLNDNIAEIVQHRKKKGVLKNGCMGSEDVQ